MSLNWRELFLPSVPVLEIFVRGSVMYLTLFVLLRLVLRRVAGTLNLGDLLIIVLIADAAQNAMSANYTSITDGIILVSTILFWSYALDWLGYRFPWFEELVHPKPRPLIRKGRLLRKNMQRELITEDELMSQLREQGIDDVKQVNMAYMEGDGRISVVKRDGKSHVHLRPSPLE